MFPFPKAMNEDNDVEIERISSSLRHQATFISNQVDLLTKVASQVIKDFGSTTINKKKGKVLSQSKNDTQLIIDPVFLREKLELCKNYATTKLNNSMIIPFEEYLLLYRIKSTSLIPTDR